jgi:hypothetical protein
LIYFFVKIVFGSLTFGGANIDNIGGAMLSQRNEKPLKHIRHQYIVLLSVIKSYADVNLAIIAIKCQKTRFYVL